QAYPDARTELEHRDAFELLVATVLSAQTTDQRVNSVTPQLFASWPDARALAGAAEQDVTALLHPLGMGATRARRIIGLAQGLLADHGGEVPDDQAALEALPGVGRKTAHVVRGTWFGHELLAVDTHVGRVSRRLGWTEATDPRRVEQDVLDRLRTDGARSEEHTAELHSLSLHDALPISGRSPMTRPLSRPCRGWAARRPTWCAAPGSGTSCSRSTPTWAACPAGSAGPRPRIRAGSSRTCWTGCGPMARRRRRPCWACG